MFQTRQSADYSPKASTGGKKKETLNKGAQNREHMLSELSGGATVH